MGVWPTPSFHRWRGHARGGQAKTVAVPWAVNSPTSDLSVLTVSVDRERIYNAPVFDFARVDEYASTGYANNIYSYYGVSGQVEVSGQPSVTGGATAATTGTASPMATVPPTATGARAYGTASPMASGSPAATASATPRTTATASPKGTRGTSREEPTRGQPKSSATPTSRGRRAEMERSKNLRPSRYRRNHGARRYAGTRINRQRSKTKGRKPAFRFFVSLTFEHSDPSEQRQDQHD